MDAMAIRLQGICKSFKTAHSGGFAALKDIDAVIRGRSVTVFKGPSGSGKTTMLSLIGAMSRPTSGRIWIGDTEISGLPERFLADIRRRRFGFVFQNFHLIPGVTVLENIMVPSYPTRASNRRIRQRAEALLEQLEIGSKAGLRAEYLSGGEQQRAAIARSLINDPEFVIADEPTAHLDTALAGRFLEIAVHLKNAGKTVLLASHDPLIFESEIVDQVIELRDGRIVKEP
ncbi:MAG: ABC transporter ATP-binding protein [Desulfobulbaceae bacterium]|nr:ABC transporter ATP-binding protein [Desulfobulbaceae bacterium]